MISFNAIPVDLRTPGQYVEFDDSRAGSGLPFGQNRILLIGQKFAGAPQPALQSLTIVSPAQANEAFGHGSMLAAMCGRAIAAQPSGEIVALPVADLDAGVNASGSITVTGPATAAGLIELRIADRRYTIAVAQGASAATVAAAIEAKVQADPDRTTNASAEGAVVTLVYRHKGLSGNAIDVRVNAFPGERLPAGIGLAFVTMQGGAGNPDIVPALAAVADREFQLIVSPWIDATNLAALIAEIEDRQGPLRMLEGIGLAAASGSFGQLAALGETLNSEHLCLFGAHGSRTSPWEWAASAAAVIGYHAAIDPARPFQTLKLAGIAAPSEADRFTRSERDLLLRDGISTFTVERGGEVAIERAITTYQADAFGVDSIAWLDLNTPLTLAYLRRAVRGRIATKYPRHKLASNDARFAPGQSVVTPAILRAELIALFRELEEAGLVEGLDQFKTDLKVERDASDPNRVNALVPPDLVNQFRVFAASIQFRL